MQQPHPQNALTSFADITPRQARLVLALILLIGLGLRIAVTLAFPMGINNFSDDNAYINSAVIFLNTGYITYALPGVPSGVLGPGMPLVLGLLFTLFGYQPAGIVAAHIAFACIGLLTAIGIYKLGALIHSRKAGVIAAALIVLDAGILSTNSVFYTETPYTCLVIFSLYGYLSCVNEWKLSRFLLGTACLCGAIAFKGLALLVPVVMALVLLKRRIRLRVWLPKALVALAICALVFLPWCVRNQRVIGTFTPFPISQGDQKLLGTYVGVGYPEGSYEEATTALDAEAWEQNFQGDKIQRIARRGEVAQERLTEWFQEQPIAFLYTHLVYKPVSLLLQPFYPDRLFNLPDRVVQYAWWGMLATAACGMILARVRKRVFKKGFWMPLLYLCLAIPLTAVMVPLARYNAPHVPFVMLYTAVWIAEVWAWLSRRKQRRTSADSQQT